MQMAGGEEQGLSILHVAWASRPCVARASAPVLNVSGLSTAETAVGRTPKSLHDPRSGMGVLRELKDPAGKDPRPPAAGPVPMLPILLIK